MTTASDTDVEWADLADPDTFTDPRLPVFWSWARAEDPVHWQRPRGDRPGFWVVTRHRDVVALLRDATRFRSAGGNVLDVLLAGGDSGGERMVPVTDGSRHTALRGVLARHFGPRALTGLRPAVERAARELVGSARAAGECDFVRAVAEALPVATICDVLDVPRADQPALLNAAHRTLVSHGADGGADVRTARNEIVRYFLALAARRRRGAADDPISVLTRARPGDEPMSDEDVALNCYSLLLGGNETTRLTIAAIAGIVAAHPEQWDAVRAGTIGIDTAVEEVLRWTSAAMHVGRRTERDTVVCGRQVLAGDIVTLWLSSANTDDTAFGDPDRLDLARTPNRHVALGGGPHFCLGADLARTEVRGVLAALRESTSGIDPIGPTTLVRSTFLRGPTAAPVRLS